MKKTFLPICLMAMFACASSQNTSPASHSEARLLDDNTFLLTELATDNTYGWEKNNPIKVGGVREQNGPKNERRFLNALLGPEGEQVSFFRAGSCCAFKTPNGIIDNRGMLDRYRISWTGSRDTLTLYLNMYDAGELKIPVGLTAKK